MFPIRTSVSLAWVHCTPNKGCSQKLPLCFCSSPSSCSPHPGVTCASAMSLWGDERFHFLNGFMSFFSTNFHIIYKHVCSLTLSHTGTSLLSRKTGCCISGHIFYTMQNQMHRYKEQWLILHTRLTLALGPSFLFFLPPPKPSQARLHCSEAVFSF